MKQRWLIHESSEFTADVAYRLENAYELVKGEDDWLSELYNNANEDELSRKFNLL